MHVSHVSNGVKRLLRQLFHFPTTSLRSIIHCIIHLWRYRAHLSEATNNANWCVAFDLPTKPTCCIVYNINILAYSSGTISAEILCWENCVLFLKIFRRKKYSYISKVCTAIMLFSLLIMVKKINRNVHLNDQLSNFFIINMLNSLISTKGSFIKILARHLQFLRFPLA